MSELNKKIQKGEGVELDFKFRIDDQKKIARTLVAFANTQGGSLLIGVKDNGKVSGTNPEEEYYMIEGAADIYTKPRVLFETQVWQEGHHLVLEVIVPKSNFKHRAKDENGAWKTYVRVNDHTLIGNKILNKVWYLQDKGVNRPEQFDDEVLFFIQKIKELEPVSLSKLYRTSGLSLKKVDRILTTLIVWGIVEMNMTEHGTTYSLIE